MELVEGVTLKAFSSSPDYVYNEKTFKYIFKQV